MQKRRPLGVLGGQFSFLKKKGQILLKEDNLNASLIKQINTLYKAIIGFQVISSIFESKFKFLLIVT